MSVILAIIDTFAPWNLLAYVLAGVAVLAASCVLHVVFSYHDKMEKALPNENAVLALLLRVPPGQYCAPSRHGLSQEEWAARCDQNVNVYVRVKPRGTASNMATPLLRSLVFITATCVCMGLLTALARPPPETAAVFIALGAGLLFTAATAWQVIWVYLPAHGFFVDCFDGAVYGCITSAVFMYVSTLV